jgi:hypothetical protein
METKEIGLRKKHLLGLDAELPYLSFGQRDLSDSGARTSPCST